MGKLPNIKNIKAEDMPQEQRSWIGRLLSPLNSFMLTVYQILNGQIEFESNIRAKIQSFTIQDSSSIDYDTLKVQVSFRPQGVMVLNVTNKTDTTALSNAVGIEWSYDGQGQVIITNVLGLVAAKKYEIKVIII